MRRATLRMTTPAAIAGLPAIAAPLLTAADADGVDGPVGVGLISRAGTDIALVRAALRVRDAVAAADPHATPTETDAA